MAGMQFWNGRRARKRLPRVRGQIKTKDDNPALSSMLAFKVGMVGVTLIENTKAALNVEAFKGATVLEVPDTEIYGLRLYKKDPKSKYIVAAETIYDSKIAEKLNLKKVKNDTTSIENFKSKIKDYYKVSLLLVAYPKSISADQNHIQKYESYVIGSSIESNFNFASALIGKKLQPEEIFKPGEFLDLASITKGKGWQGEIKRKGIRRQFHKATEKIRHVGTLGAFTPGKILYTVPRAGQMGYNYRTEKDKELLKIGDISVDNINPKSGFKNYGLIKNKYLLISGSIPGTAKREVRVRKSQIGKRKGIKEVNLNYISSQS